MNSRPQLGHSAAKIGIPGRTDGKGTCSAARALAKKPARAGHPARPLGSAGHFLRRVRPASAPPSRHVGRPRTPGSPPPPAHRQTVPAPSHPPTRRLQPTTPSRQRSARAQLRQGRRGAPRPSPSARTTPERPRVHWRHTCSRFGQGPPVCAPVRAGQLHQHQVTRLRRRRRRELAWRCRLRRSRGQFQAVTVGAVTLDSLYSMKRGTW